MGGVVLSESVTTKNQPVLIRTGTGTLTVQDTKTLSTTGQLLTLTTDDLDIAGGVSTGVALMYIGPYTGDRQISIGSIASGVHLSDPELGHLTTSQGITIGDSSSGNIVVSGVTDSSSDVIATLNLVATKANRLVTFKTEASSFNKGITVLATGGIVLSESATTKNWPTLLNAGTGTITVAASKTLSSTNQLLTLTSDDVDFSASSTVSTGTTTLLVATKSPRTIGIGTTTEQFDLEASEFGTFNTAGVVIGSVGVSKGLKVVGIPNVHSQHVAGMVTLLTTVDDEKVTFAEAPSSFHALAVQSDNGIWVHSNVSTTVGSLYLDGDTENSSSSDNLNKIALTDGVTLNAKTFMTLEATTGTLERSGRLTLKAGRGIVLLNDLNDMYVGGTACKKCVKQDLVVHTGYDVSTDGTLTVAANKAVDTGGHVLITAMDLDLQGGLTTGNATVAIQTSGMGRYIGVGIPQKDLQVDANEVQRMTTSGLSIGGPSSGTVTVGGVTEANSATVAGIVSLAATSDRAQLLFTAQQAKFGAVAAQADNGIILQSDIETLKGVLTIDGDVDDTATALENHNKIEISGQRLVKAAGRLTLDSTSGGIVRSGTGTLTLIGADGVIVNDNIQSLTAGQPLFINADSGDGVGGAGNGIGTLTVKATTSVTSNNGVITITAADVNIANANIVSGTAATKIATSKPGLTIGLGSTSMDLWITGSELQGISATGLVVGSGVNGDVVVDGIQATHSTAITDVVTIAATGNNRFVTFTQTRSTFNALAAQAGNGVFANSGITSIVGGVTLDGDFDRVKTGNFADRVTIASDKTLTAHKKLTLDSRSGGIIHKGRLTLNARDGVVLNDNMLGQKIENPVMINADVDANGVGAFTLKSGITVNSKDSTVTITAADIDVFGSLTTGTQGIILHASGTDRTIGLGSTVKDMHLADSELGHVTSTGLTMGSSHSGNVVVNGIQDSSTKTIGILVLVATKASRSVTFESNPSAFNKGITVQAIGGIVFSESMTSKNSQTILQAGTGTLTVASTKSLATTNQELLITADDIDIKAGATVSAGTAVVTITTQGPNTIGLGTTSEQMDIELSELQNIHASGLTIGSKTKKNKSILVKGVTKTASSGITDFVSLIAAVDDSKVVFSTTPSTFAALAAQADNGIIVSTTVISTKSYMYLDGDVDKDNKGDDDNSVRFSDDLTITAKTTLTLQSFTGSVFPSGALTLKAGSGIVCLNDIKSLTPSRPLVMDADYESGGDGILTVATSKILDSNKGTVTVTAADVDFGGIVRSDLLTVHTATAGGTMALGTFVRNFTISSDDMQNIIAKGLILGNNINGDITVSGVKAVSSNNVVGVTSLVALKDNNQVMFRSLGSTFNALSVQADSGIDVQVDLSTDVGVLTLNGDADSTSVGDTPNTIAFTGSRSLRAAGLLTVNDPSSGMYRKGVGALTLRSGTGIILNAALASETDGQGVIINSHDVGGVWSAADTSGVGVLTLAAGRMLNTQNGAMSITASDLDLQGQINTGNKALLLTVSRSGSTVGLGATTNTAQGFTLSGSELQRITSAGLTLGNIVNSSIEVDGVTRANSNTISGIVSLVATNQNAGVAFKTSGSTFAAVAATADDGIDIEKSLTTTLGSIIMEGDADNHDDGKSRDHIAFGNNLALTSELDIDLKAKTGGIKLAGPITLKAKRYINIHNKFTGPFGAHNVTIVGDSDNDGVGGVSVAASACSLYSNSASCVASRLCAWCGSEAKTIGEGVISTSGGAGTVLNGKFTKFSSDAAIKVGNLITISQQSRKITAVTSDSLATVESKFTRAPSGFLSVYAGALDQVVGSVKTRFDKELKPGYTVTVGGVTSTVASVTSYKSFTATSPLSLTGNNLLYTIGKIAGSGTVSTDSGQSVTVTGSWPPAATKFSSQLKPGSYITIGEETRVVATVMSDQLLTVTTPFTWPYHMKTFKISNIAGTGSLSVTSGSTAVSGSDLAPTKFTTELRIGDIITASGQTKMVQTITDDNHLSVSSVFSTPANNLAYIIGNVHNAPFTIAQQATGEVYSASAVITGIGTSFGAQLEVGYSIFAKVGNNYEQRTIKSIATDTALTMNAAFSVDISSASKVALYYQTCPTQNAEMDDNTPGTFALHAKTVRPSICFNTGRCVPRASHKTTFETAGTGIIAGSTSSTMISGTGTNFLAQLKHGNSISVYTATKKESRKVISVTSATSVVIDSPFSFDITPVSNQPFIVHYLTGTGKVSNAGGTSTLVVGTGTLFTREVAVGYVIGIGNEKRVVTSLTDDTHLTVSSPFNYAHGGVTNSGFVFEACMSGVASTVKQLTIDYAELKPGCCGFKAVGAVSGSNFAYYKVVPPSTNYNLRVVTTSSTPQLEVFMRYTWAPDAINYDFKAVGTSSPWQIELPQNRLRCPSDAASCDSLWIGVRGLSGGGANIAYEVASYLEFNFPSFACSESSAATLSLKCSALGLKQIGDASFVNDATDTTNESVMRLTSASSLQTGAVWYGTKVHLENGFETSFTFRLKSACATNPTEGCGAGDGFAFVIQGTSAPDKIGCGGRGLGFATDAGCSKSITHSFAVEFDTWHNPELRDINVRGSGIVQVNATTVPRYNYVHAAFFSNGEKAVTNSHDGQLAGTPAIPAINDGKQHSARVVYIPGTSAASPGRLFLYIDDMQSFVLTAPVRFTKAGACGVGTTDRCVLDTFGNAYLGFTASTGEMGQTHDVSKWLFCDEPGCGRE
jgi:hypothetical protein